MWSDKYRYYSIQSDLDFSQKIEVESVIDILLKTNCFIQRNYQSFENTENFPLVDITLVMTKDGNFKTVDEPLKYVNLISIVCSKGSNIDQTIYTKIFLKIAQQLDWKLFLEEDDFGNENIEIEQ